MMQSCFGPMIDMSGAFQIEQFDIGTRKDEELYTRMTVSADDEVQLRDILHELHQNGTNLPTP